ncbi:MAG: carbon starvation protein A [Candidatus Geothermarchaeales archaeon]
MTPFWLIVAALIAYAVAYWGYSRWYDRNVWRPEPSKTTPAHMYMDGIEFFPVSKYVLWGYQFKSVAALGPILGPFIAITYGWLPALIWIILGNFFIGWLQDYSAIMVSVKNDGKSFGPLTYEFMGSRARGVLLGFILFYLLIISAVFIFLISLFWNIFPTTFSATIGMIIAGVITGVLLFRMKVNVFVTTFIALIIAAISIYLPSALPALQTPKDFLGPWTLAFWAAVLIVILFIGAILPMPTFTQPVLYIAFYPAILAVILIILGSLFSPITGIELLQPSFKTFYTEAAGPLWPMLFVAIACGAISGWHSLVGSGSTAKQIDIETDARPVGAGAMLSEGLLALASVAAFMVLSPDEAAVGNVGSWVAGSVRLTMPWLGGEAVKTFLATFFGLALVIYALTVQWLVTRFWRTISSEVFGESILGQRHVATIIGLIIPWLFAVSGSWINLWLYFGGSNQLLAGLALMIATIFLAKIKRPTIYTLGPAVFMIVTTLAALLWETWVFTRAVLTAKPLVRPPLNAFPSVALAMNGVFIAVGVILFVLGLLMTRYTFSGFLSMRAGPSGGTPSAPSSTAVTRLDEGLSDDESEKVELKPSEYT